MVTPLLLVLRRDLVLRLETCLEQITSIRSCWVKETACSSLSMGKRREIKVRVSKRMVTALKESIST